VGTTPGQRDEWEGEVRTPAAGEREAGSQTSCPAVREANQMPETVVGQPSSNCNPIRPIANAKSSKIWANVPIVRRNGLEIYFDI
jgi:hypothetical protein